MKSLFVTVLFMLGSLAGNAPTAPGMSKEASSVVAGAPVAAIVGRVRVDGPVEKPAPLPVYKNRDFCGPSIENESLIVGGGGAVKNVVVVVHGAIGVIEETSPSIVLDNKNCKFTPHVQAVQVGSEVSLRNSDPILHDVHAHLNSETLFNVGLPSWREVKKRLMAPGVISIGCEVLHTWMSAFIVVTESPHFTVTDSEGQFALEEVPAGEYVLEFWHERLGRISRDVVVQAGRSTRIDVVFGPPEKPER